MSGNKFKKLYQEFVQRVLIGQWSQSVTCAILIATEDTCKENMEPGSQIHRFFMKVLQAYIERQTTNQNWQS